MTPNPEFETLLTGGHPNSLGNTVDVVERALAEDRVADLYSCYGSDDEVVRLRVSNGMKRIAKADRTRVIPLIDGLITEIAAIDQASAQWTLAELFALLWDDMDETQQASAQAIVKRNLSTSRDWIVLNKSMDAVARWAKADATLAAWLRPHLERLAGDDRRSVASRAEKHLSALG